MYILFRVTLSYHFAVHLSLCNTQQHPSKMQKMGGDYVLICAPKRKVLAGILDFLNKTAWYWGTLCAMLCYAVLCCAVLCCAVLRRFSRVWFRAFLWTVAHQDPLSMGFSSKNTGVGCHALLQGIFPIQGSNAGLLHCRQILYPWDTGKAPWFPLPTTKPKKISSSDTIIHDSDDQETTLTGLGLQTYFPYIFWPLPSSI